MTTVVAEELAAPAMHESDHYLSAPAVLQTARMPTQRFPSSVLRKMPGRDCSQRVVAAAAKQSLSLRWALPLPLNCASDIFL
jgi:hypothetical protein